MAKLKKPKHSEHFLQQAAKLTIYPTDIYAKTVLVPKDEAETWTACLGAKYLRDECEFEIVFVDEVIKKNIYNPAMQLDNYVKPVVVSKYSVGQNFRLVKGFSQIELTAVTATKLSFKYVGNIVKKDGTMKPEDLDRVLKQQNAYEVPKHNI